jgi:hypothetical protein
LILFKIYNEKELEVIYDEYPMDMNFETWKRAYDYCTADDYSFMFYNTQAPKNMRVMKNFTEYIVVKNTE